MDQQKIKLPQELSTRLQDQLGSDFPAFLNALEDSAPTSIRINPGKLTEYSASALPIPWCKQGRYLETRPRFTSDPLYHAGTYYVQEASSMFLGYMLETLIDLQQDHRVLDLSAAPGGKSTLMQSMLSRDSLFVANEVISSRNKTLRHNLARWGYDNHIVTQSDPRFFAKLPDFFDLILVDAPCSGEGLIRKDSMALEEWSQQNVNLCASRQKRILADILPSLAPGGILIYSTCTYSEDENEANMSWLLKQNELTPLIIDIPDSFGIVRSGPSNAGIRFYPHKVRGEGFFIAAFKKEELEHHPHQRSRDQQKKKSVSKPTQEDRKWLVEPERYIYLDQNENRTAIPQPIHEDYLRIERALRITYAGVYLGKVYHDKLKPSPELALSQSVTLACPRLELSVELALDYLSHMDLGSRINVEQGYYLVTHAGFGLGWIHVLNNGQIRNKFPSAWRILQRFAKTRT